MFIRCGVCLTSPLICFATDDIDICVCKYEDKSLEIVCSLKVQDYINAIACFGDNIIVCGDKAGNLATYKLID